MKCICIREDIIGAHIEEVIPHKKIERAYHDPNVIFDKEAYLQLHVVGQCVGWLKEPRRVATRFEKLAVHFLGMLQLGMMRQCRKLLFSNRG